MRVGGWSKKRAQLGGGGPFTAKSRVARPRYRRREKTSRVRCRRWGSGALDVKAGKKSFQYPGKTA